MNIADEQYCQQYCCIFSNNADSAIFMAMLSAILLAILLNNQQYCCDFKLYASWVWKIKAIWTSGPTAPSRSSTSWFQTAINHPSKLNTSMYNPKNPSKVHNPQSYLNTLTRIYIAAGGYDGPQGLVVFFYWNHWQVPISENYKPPPPSRIAGISKSQATFQ